MTSGHGGRGDTDLVGPLDDDALDVVLEEHVTVEPLGLAHPLLLFVYVGHALQQGLRTRDKFEGHLEKIM